MSGPAWTIRPAAPADAADMVTIIRGAFPARLLDLYIYGCSGITEFITEQIGVQDYGGDTYYTVAAANGKVVACAEVRRLPNCLFLNYIAVRAPFRSQGLGRHLLRSVLEANNSADVNEIALDVLECNTGARQWYERLGFRRHESIVWWQAPLGEGRPAPIFLVGYAQAQACHRRYGFSKFGVCAAAQHYEVGRLGEDWYRLTTPEALASPGLVAGLKRLAPGRRLLLLTKADSPDVSLPEAREAARSHRLVASLDVLRQRLS
jgi:ribosomal protein S18 acetylase RimI-like enzyme